jgi:hypothetical protein
LIDLLAAVVLYMAATYCVALGLTCLVAPARATRFLMGFVRSAAAHYSEIALRLLVGWAFLRDAHLTAFPAVFVGFGSVLVVTSCILLVVPWFRAAHDPPRAAASAADRHRVVRGRHRVGDHDAVPRRLKNAGADAIRL